MISILCFRFCSKSGIYRFIWQNRFLSIYQTNCFITVSCSLRAFIPVHNSYQISFFIQEALPHRCIFRQIILEQSIAARFNSLIPLISYHQEFISILEDRRKIFGISFKVLIRRYIVKFLLYRICLCLILTTARKRSHHQACTQKCQNSLSFFCHKFFHKNTSYTCFILSVKTIA